MRSQAWIWTLLLIAAVMSWLIDSPIPALCAALTFAIAWFMLGLRRSNAGVRATSARVERILVETFPDE